MSGLYEQHMKFGTLSPAIDTERCRVETYEGISRNFTQCARRKTVEVDGIGYCKQHSPGEVAKRRQAQQDKYEAERQISERRYVRPNEYRDALREIAAGHNDPRALAEAVLAKWGDQPSPVEQDENK